MDNSCFIRHKEKKGRDCSLPDDEPATQGPVRMGNGKAFFHSDEPPTLLFARIL
jgi:hypothetical protein